MNRQLTEVGSATLPAERQRELWHRYVLGVYDLMDRLTTDYPHILLENCSGGGARFDPGMLYYMPQTWCSDNTDAVCRMKIQYATSLTYPPITMGAHVSVVPNQQTGRVSPLATRGYVAMSGNFGYELDLGNLKDEELEYVKEQIQCYKMIRPVIQHGDFYRIRNPFNENLAAWNFVSQDQKRAVAFFFEILSQPAAPVRILKLKGLHPDKLYRRYDNGEIYSGDELMYCGISIPLKKEDFRGEMYCFEEIEKGEENGTTKKRKRYEAIVQQVIELAGRKKNILGIAHCATRLRLVLEDNDSADLKNMENVDLVKGVFVAGDQVQIIFGAGLVNDICQVLGETLHMDTMSLGDLKTKAGQKMNFLQKALKALSDVFIEIMPGILAAALLTGLSSVLGNMKAVESNETLYGIARLINISSGAIFGFLPLCVAYSAVKRFGGRPIMGIVIGCIMLSGSLADAYAAAQGTVEVTTLHIFGLGVDLVGFQGGIIVALLMGLVTAKLDIFFERKVPEVIRLLVSPLLTTLVSSFLLFLLIGPIGRGLASGITNVLVWMTRNLGIFGYAAFSGVQQLIVITGLHHVFGAIESQLLVDTGRNFLNPLMSVAIIAQGEQYLDIW